MILREKGECDQSDEKMGPGHTQKVWTILD